MNRIDVAKMLTVLSTAYPSLLKNSGINYDAMLELWAEMFIDDEEEKVLAAIMMYIDEDNNYFPAIGEIKENLRVLSRWLSQKVSVKEFLGTYMFSKLPLRTRQYIEKVEASRIPEPVKPKPVSDGEPWTAEMFFEKVNELMNNTGRTSLRMPD